MQALSIIEYLKVLKEGGSGLGVSSKRLDNGLRLEGRPETFFHSIVITVSGSAHVSSDALLDEVKRFATACKILVVDDDRGLMLFVERILQASGKYFDVRRAYDGQHCLDLIRAQKPDIVLLDMTTPVLDGMGLLEYLLTDVNLKTVPVVLLTASSYTKEQSHHNQFTVYRQTGLYPTEVLEFLNAAVSALKPRYYTSTKECDMVFRRPRLS